MPEKHSKNNSTAHNSNESDGSAKNDKSESSGICSYKGLAPIQVLEIGGFAMIFLSTALFFANDSLNFGYLICNIPTLLLLFNFDEIMTVGYANLITLVIFVILFIIKQGK